MGIIKNFFFVFIFFLLLFFYFFIPQNITKEQLFCKVINRSAQYNKQLFNYETFIFFKDFCYDFAKDLDFNNINEVYRKKIILDQNDKKYFSNNFNEKLDNTWLYSHKDQKSNKFIFYDKFEKNSIKNLKIVSEINLDRIEKKKNNVEVSPVFFENFMIFADLKNNLICYDVLKKQVKWKKSFNHEIARRSIQITDYKKNKIVLLPSANGVYIVDFNSGKQIKKIGNDDSKIQPIILEDTITVFTYNSKVINYKIDTGKILWEISLRNDSFLRGASLWGGVSYSEKYKKAFVSVGSPKIRSDFIGISRPGDNLYSNSVVAIDLEKGTIDWFFQDTAHDLWDLDMAFPPILKTLRINKNLYDCVVVVSKSGNVFILHQLTGKSLFDYNLISTPQSKIPGEIVSPLQIETIHPPKLLSQEIKKENIANYDKEIYEETLEYFKTLKSGNYLPPELNQDIAYNGVSGGGQWFGGVIDNNDILYVPINFIPWLTRIETRQLRDDGIKNQGKKIYLQQCASCHGENKSTVIEKNNRVIQPSIAGSGYYKFDTKEKYMNILAEHKNIDLKKEDKEYLISYLLYSDKLMHQKKNIALKHRTRYFLDNNNNLAVKAPWSKIYAIELKSGKVIYSRPLGNQYYNLKNGEKILVEGSESWAGISIINDIIIASGSYDKKIYFYDTKSGNEIYSLQFDHVGSAPPSIHIFKDKVYFAFVLTGGGREYGTGSKLLLLSN